METMIIKIENFDGKSTLIGDIIDERGVSTLNLQIVAQICVSNACQQLDNGARRSWSWD